MSKIKGKAMWAYVIVPNTRFTPKYTIDLVVDEEGKALLEKNGIQVSPYEEAFKAKFTLNVTSFSGEINEPPIVVDCNNEIMDINIGNGSEVIVMYHPYEWSHSGRTGTKAILEGIQVIKLVEYLGKEEFEVLPEVEDNKDTPPAVGREVDEELPDTSML